MPFLISSDISTIIEERIRILTNLSQAKSIAAQLQGHSSQLIHYVTDVATSEQIPARLTSEGTPSAELTVALTLLEAEFEKINESQTGIKTYESQIQREKEKRRVLLIGTGVAAIIVIVFLANMVLKQREPIPTDQASKPSPTLASQQINSKGEDTASEIGGNAPTRTSSPPGIREESATAPIAIISEPEESRSERSASTITSEAAPLPKTLTTTSSNIRNSPPIPRIISVQTIPEQVISAQPFRVRVEATNDGGDTVDGYINISSPDNPTLKIVSHSATGETDANYIIEPGAELYRFPDGGPVESTYVLVEVRIRDWPQGNVQYLEVEITPRDGSQTTTLFTRVSLSWKTLSDIIIEPNSSLTIDQQGFPVYSYELP
jgi:hypothetical protein